LRVLSTLSIIRVFEPRLRMHDRLPYLFHHGINIITPRQKQMLAMQSKCIDRMRVARILQTFTCKNRPN